MPGRCQTTSAIPGSVRGTAPQIASGSSGIRFGFVVGQMTSRAGDSWRNRPRWSRRPAGEARGLRGPATMIGVTSAVATVNVARDLSHFLRASVRHTEAVLRASVAHTEARKATLQCFGKIRPKGAK
jgi:hypothetical protein